MSLVRLFDPDLRGVTFHTSLLMGAFVWMYQSTTIWYPTLLPQPEATAAGVSAAAECWRPDWLDGVRHALRELGRAPRRRHRRVVAGLVFGACLPVLQQLWRTHARRVPDRLLRFRRLGHRPGLPSERFPTEARGVGTGFSYHVGVGIGAFAPYRSAALQDAGTDLLKAMMWCIIGGGVGVVTLLWLGPETKGRSL